MALQDVKIVISDRSGITVTELFQYSSYSFSHSYNALSSTFSLTLVDPDFKVETEYYIQFYINDKIAFTGIVQRKEINVDKNRISVNLAGKDLSSLLVETYCNVNFKDYNEYPYVIINELVAQTSFLVQPKGVDNIQITASANDDPDDLSALLIAMREELENVDTLSNKNLVEYDDAFSALGKIKNFKINVGDIVYDKISELIERFGYNALFEEGGRLFIGNLNKKRDEDPIKYDIINRKTGNQSSVISASFQNDVSDLYSVINVYSQVEETGKCVLSNPVITNSDVKIKKTMSILIDNEDDPVKAGRLIYDNQNIDSYRLNYIVPGHVQGGDFWRINRYCNVYDEILKIKKNLVIYDRSFNFSLNEGFTTSLSLSYPRTYPKAGE